MTRENIHGTGLVLDGKGVLLRGPSGAGKSLIALELLNRFAQRRLPASLIADDRIDLETTTRALVMHAPPNIAGLIELRGRGIVTRPSRDKATLHLVVDLVPELTRFLEEEELTTELNGKRVARCPVPQRGTVDSAHQMLLIVEALAALAPVPRRARSAAGEQGKK